MTVLDLDGTHPPGVPKRSSIMLGFRVPPSVAAWVREQADQDRVSVALWLQRLVERAKLGEDRLPTDVRAWLVVQAAQCGCPGDPDRALVEVVRHLARLWPSGARLAADDGVSTAERLATAQAQIGRLQERNRRLAAQLREAPLRGV